MTAKKFLSAASALTERSSSSPTYMLWTVPTTLFALLGGVYLIGEKNSSEWYLRIFRNSSHL